MQGEPPVLHPTSSSSLLLSLLLLAPLREAPETPACCPLEVQGLRLSSKNGLWAERADWGTRPQFKPLHCCSLAV